MSKKQIEQFNRMRETLRRIAHRYKSASCILAGPGELGLSPEETLEAAYDNIQAAAECAVKGVREIPAATP